MGTVFLGPQRNGRATNECSFSQAKRRLLVHTAMKESNHWRWIYEWFKRQNRVGDTFLWQQWTQAQVFQNHFHWRWSSKTTWWRMTSSLLLGPLIWVIISIHSLVYGCCLHSPYTPGIVQLLQKGDQSSLEPTRLAHQRKEYLCCQRLISVQSNMCLVETRTQGTLLIQPGKWFPKSFIQIIYITLTNT